MLEFRINFKKFSRNFLENCCSSSQVLIIKGGAKKGSDGFPGDSCPQDKKMDVWEYTILVLFEKALVPSLTIPSISTDSEYVLLLFHSS